MNELLETIAQRRAIYPDRFNDKVIQPEEIRLLLEAARFAPTHKLTEPWRFYVLMGSSKYEMAEKLKDYIEKHTDKPGKGERIHEKFDQSQAVIVVGFQRDLQERLPEWEEIAATAMAVQNIWILAGSLDMGGYWSTGAPAVDALSHEISLKTGERILGMFFLGRHDYKPRVRPAKTVDDFTTWMI